MCLMELNMFYMTRYYSASSTDIFHWKNIFKAERYFQKKKTFSGGNFLLKIPLKNQLKNGFPETETEMKIPVENLRVTLYKANTEHSDVDLLQGVSSICSPGVCLYSNFCCAHPGGSVCSATQSPCSSTTLCIRRYSLTNFRRLI